ncbi:MAG: hypothetical protein DMG41_11890 [Acidobacteria bacterium]|nr:MAG: hypothetical protein AUH13_11765 [Acidobacteria bacterium 13_2_20CM_58_27]PYT88435.1 MAG: hypothetical protein DMG41_11890 [Acidobacteriota bacterium]
MLLLSWPASSARLPQTQRGTTRSPHGALAIPCENCHTATAWRPIKAVPEFDHNKTKYPLRGMHEKVQCTQCHVKPVFTDVGKNCQDCHTDIHQRQMGTNCADCHTVQGWKIAVQQVKEHQNRFPLLGAHAAVQCEDCHKGAAVGQFQGLSTACISCHQKDLQQTQTMGGTVPNHIAAQFPTTCETCHNFDSWLGASVNHAAPPINFPLTNGHANVSCESCHVGGNYNLQIVATDCGHAGCHLTTWQQTTNPAHTAAPTVFPIATCSNCHNTVSWQNANFNHATTGFPLANSHQMAPAGKVNACTDCHINNNYNLTTQATDCGNAGCHLNTNYGGGWQGTTTPVHAQAGSVFAVANCSSCHNTVSFLTATFDHSATGFPLTGSHQLAPAGRVNACSDCHISNNYALTIGPTDCGNSQCHLTTWQQTNNPTHSAAGAPFAAANCSTCHNPTLWTNVVFNHAATGWPLTGSHQLAPAGKVVACTDCHTGNNYNLTAANTDCYGCHQTAWLSTTKMAGSIPNHVTAGFSTSMCSTCHDTVLWSDGKFDHSTTGFPLQGPHMLPPRTTVTGAIGPMVNACTDCHTGGNYTAGYPTMDCYGCHQTYYTNAQTYGATVPNHITASYPTACVSCHTTYATTAWMGAVFNHTFFRIPHNGSVCSDCHTVATDYKKFSCENCHTQPNAHRPGMSHPNVCSPSPACWYNPPTRCYDCHKG